MASVMFERTDDLRDILSPRHCQLLGTFVSSVSELTAALGSPLDKPNNWTDDDETVAWLVRKREQDEEAVDDEDRTLVYVFGRVSWLRHAEAKAKSLERRKWFLCSNDPNVWNDFLQRFFEARINDGASNFVVL